MTPTDWLWILHPALAVVVVYPLLGMVVRLAWSIRWERSSGAGRPHGDLGRWLATGVVLLVLTALTVVIATKVPPDRFPGGPARAAELLLVLLGTLGSLPALWRCRPAAGRLGFALLSWAGVLLLGAQPEVWRLSDDPLSLAFWQSHYWAGVIDRADAFLPGSVAGDPAAAAAAAPACECVDAGGTAVLSSGHHGHP